MHDDEDRAAILRRRQRFIFLALSGLTGAAGCEEPAPPAATAEVVREEPIVEEPAPPPAAESEATVEELAVAEADEPYVVDPAEVRHAEEAKRRAQRPQVCLSIRRPCLSPRPQVCLTRLPLKPGTDDEPV